MPLSMAPIHPQELGSRRRDLEAMVARLEEAYADGNLDELLGDPGLPALMGGDLVEVYRELAGKRRRPSPVRAQAVPSLLAGLDDYLQEPRHTFDGGGGLRESQMLAARFWGHEFRFADSAETVQFTTALFQVAAARLAGDVRDLGRIEQWLRRKPKLGDSLQLMADREGRRFEHLLLDVLNEQTDMAVRAGLAEDFLEKTDLRVHVPGVKRRRGARVQVTRLAHRERLNRKLSRVEHVGEFVVLSPWTLAGALLGPNRDAWIPATEREAVWACLPHAPARVEELASTLRSMLTPVESDADRTPWGPASSVPEPLRHAVRAFVVHEAHRATSVLREREQRTGRRAYGRRK